MLHVVGGLALGEQGRTREAVAQLYLGRALERAGRPAEAQAAFANAARLGRGDVKAAAQRETR